MLVEHFDDTGEVEQGAREPIDLVEHHAVYLAGPDVGEQALQRRAVHVGAGVADVVVLGGQGGPTLAGLAADVGFGEQGGEFAPVAGEIWGLIAKLNIGSPRTTIVSGSKALHHLLPDLVPPIDRAYTLRFFFGPRVLGEAKEEPAFHLMYPQFRQIAVACKGAIDQRLAQPTEWDTSITKVIDNAIVGYVRAHRAPKASDG